jgi:hypothetical protein
MPETLKFAPLLGALMLSLTACATGGGGSSSGAPPAVALPNGYYLQRDKASNIGLVKRGGKQIVSGPVAAYDVEGNLVAGAVGRWPERGFSYPNESPFPDSPDAKYFILDTTSGQLESGMDPAAWRAKLKSLGASETLKITAPALP